MSSSWQNKFATILAWKKTNLENLSWTRESLGKSRSLEENFSTPFEQKKIWLEVLKRIRGTASLYLHHLSPLKAQLSVQSPPCPTFLPWGKMRMHQWAPSFPSCVGHSLKKRPTSFSPHSNYWVVNCRIRAGSGWDNSSHRSEGNFQR